MFQKAEKVETEIVSHWHPNLTICLVTDQTNWTKGSLPQPFSDCSYLNNDSFICILIELSFIIMQI